MVKKIVRGTLIGGFLGIVLGLAVSYTINIVNFMNNEEKSLGEDEVVKVFYAENSSENINVAPPECNDLQDIILRFHVRAHSNSDEDIALKFQVRDAVLEHIGEDLSKKGTREEVLGYIEENLLLIESIAKKTIQDAGYGYTVKVYISNDYFPIRQYGELVLPAGYYQALRIDIGLAEGENFWCILYPMMCYPVDSAAVVSKEDEKCLMERLKEDDFEKLFVSHDTGDNEVKVRFKLLEWLGL